MNLCLAPQILAFSFLFFVCLFLAICDSLIVQASPELVIASLQPLQCWDDSMCHHAQLSSGTNYSYIKAVFSSEAKVIL